MSSSPKSWTDRVWLVWFSIQPFSILLVDAVGLYPKWLYEPPSAPLHFLQQIRTWYLTTYNDPITGWEFESSTGHDTWIHLFLLIELCFSLPVVLYAIYRFGFTARGTTVGEELMFLLYGFETALTTLVCLYDIQFWDKTLYPAALKREFYQMFTPWFVVPALLTANMCYRIIARSNAADRAAQGKKRQ